MRRPFLVLALLLAATAPARAGSGQDGAHDIEASVSQATANGVYLGVGSDAGVAVGTRGTLERDGRVLGEIEVRNVSATSCFAAFVTRSEDSAPQSGDRAILHGVTPPGAPAARAPANGQRGDGKPFTPLLAPYEAIPAESKGNYFHGFATASTSWLHDDEGGLDYANHRVSLGGDIERLFHGPWSLQFRLNVDTRDGDGYDTDPKQGEPRLRLDSAVLRRHFEDGSVAGIGRFQPLALPGIGRIDGAFAEKVVGDGARLGALLGVRPDRDDLAPRTDEVVAAGWGAWEHRFGEKSRFAAAAGVLTSWYQGSADQQAMLADVSASFDGGHWVRLSSQSDLYSGSEPTRSGVGLTRLNASGFWHATDVFGLRATWSQYQNADTDSMRTIVPDDSSYGRGRRRAALASLESWRASGVGLEQEVAQLAGEGGSDWQFTLRARDSTLFGLESFSADAVVFNLVGIDTQGYGGGAGLGWIPTAAVSLRLGWDATTTEFDGGTSIFSHTISLFASAQLSASASLWARVAKSLGDELNASSADLGVTWRF